MSPLKSMSVTVKEQTAVLLAASVAVQVTRVVPNGNVASFVQLRVLPEVAQLELSVTLVPLILVAMQLIVTPGQLSLAVTTKVRFVSHDGSFVTISTTFVGQTVNI